MPHNWDKENIMQVSELLVRHEDPERFLSCLERRGFENQQTAIVDKPTKITECSVAALLILQMSLD